MGGEGIHNPADTGPLLGAIAWNLLYLEAIYGEVNGLDGDAMRGTDGAALAAVWTAALATALANYTAARAGYLDELAAANIPADIDTLLARLTALRAGYLDELGPTNLPSDIDDLLTNLAIVDHHGHARTRVYPRVPSSVIQITANAAADTWGNWTQVVPINTIDFDYHPIAVMVEQASAAATFIIQFGCSTDGGSDPTTAQIVGEQRFVALGAPIKTYHTDLELLGADCPANSKLWARIMTETLNADTCDISITVTRHIAISNPVANLTTWPWAT